MREYVRLLFLFRFFLRVFSFSYPLFITVMYNFWIFMGVPSKTLVVYISVMGVVELIVVLFWERSWVAILSKVYVVSALIFEFPSAVVGLLAGGRTFGYLPFFGWALLWYLPVFLIALTIVGRFGRPQ